MARRRFVAPAREAVDRAVFAHPAFASYAAHFDLLTDASWPTLDTLNARFGDRTHPTSGAPLRFMPQSQQLLADGLHYERRILERGVIATRERNWHDLFNALVWIEHPALKAAMNVRQVADIDRAGPGRRTRAQYALTQFDEAGAIVVLRDAALLEAWDRHDWRSLFAAWRAQATHVVVVGHALLEHLVAQRQDLVAKTIVITGSVDVRSAVRCAASAIEGGEALDDPQRPRPLPLCGIPGWHEGNEAPEFIAASPCFAPTRSGAGVRPRGEPLAVD